MNSEHVPLPHDPQVDELGLHSGGTVVLVVLVEVLVEVLLEVEVLLVVGVAGILRSSSSKNVPVTRATSSTLPVVAQPPDASAFANFSANRVSTFATQVS